MARRTNRFYFKNENELMRDLGLTPTKNSGAGWIEKEDGYNDHVIAQLKSTDANSMSLKLLDIQKLEKNAYITKKLPLFVIQFLKHDDKYLMVKYEDIVAVAKYIETGIYEDLNDVVELEETKSATDIKVKNSKSARDKFYKEKQKQWEDKKWKK